jgi:phage gp46-like protein
MPIALRWNNDLGVAELRRTSAGALAEDDSLETVVLLSLFTDAPATAEEITRAGEGEQRGWWAHADTVRAGGRVYGSKLWLLRRGKTTLATLRAAEGYVVEALTWLVDLKIAAKIEVLATRPASGVMALDIRITRPQKLLPPFVALWNVRTNALS